MVFPASVSTSQGHLNCLILVWISHEFGYKRLDFLVQHAAAIVMDIHPLCIIHLLLETYYHIHLSKQRLVSRYKCVCWEHF